MSKVIFIENPDHQDHQPINRICWPSYNDASRPENMTDEDYLQHVVEVNIANGTISETATLAFVDSFLIPADHTHVDAWEVIDGAIVLNDAKVLVIDART